MARPKSATHELQREAILNQAAQCFAQRSYLAASMNDIAAACGTSKARLYHYYGSKEAILFDLLDRYTQRLLATEYRNTGSGLPFPILNLHISNLHISYSPPIFKPLDNPADRGTGNVKRQRYRCLRMTALVKSVGHVLVSLCFAFVFYVCVAPDIAV